LVYTRSVFNSVYFADDSTCKGLVYTRSVFNSVYFADDSTCKGLVYTRSVFNSRQSTDKHEFPQSSLQVALRKIYRRYNDIVSQCNRSLGKMLPGVFLTNS
jgi:hypothetical protein